MTQEHIDVMVLKCSKYKKVEMPSFPQILETQGKNLVPRSIDLNVTDVTPDPNTTKEVDPSIPATSALVSAVAVKSCEMQDNGKGVNSDKAPPLKPSKQMLETHRKWQEAAEAMGGPGSRIVVSKPEAKKLIYEELYDEFRPMNITDIYKVSLINRFIIAMQTFANLYYICRNCKLLFQI